MNNREYRSMEMRVLPPESEEKRYMVEGYASTFSPYKMFSDGDTDYYERIERTAFDDADLSDVVFRVDHEGRVYARSSAGTVEMWTDDHGLGQRTDLSKTQKARELFADIEAGNYPQMSFAFTVAEDHYDKATHTRVIDRIAKVFDVSPVAFPANPTTELSVSTRDYFNGVIEAERAERLAEEERKAENGEVPMNEKETEELIEEREALAAEVEAPEADKEAIEEEARAIDEELESRKAEEAERVEIRKQVAEMNTEPVKEFNEERKTMTLAEIRSSEAYINAFANYIKTEDDSECRALLTDIGGGTVPTPTIVDERIRTNWAKLGLMDKVRKTYVKGILKVGFEKTATAATAHTEGAAAPDAETLTLGVVSLTPVSLKKWIQISDEAMDLTGEAFLNYIYDEISYQIAKLAQSRLIAAITALTASAGTNAVSVGVVAGTPSQGVIAEAIGTLSDNAGDPCVVMNKGSWAKFKAAQYSGNFNADPFEGLDVYFDNSLPVYATTGTASTTWAIVGDFGYGAQANFPNGEEITLKFDDLSLAESDLVKIVGREYVGLGIVGDKAFAKITF